MTASSDAVILQTNRRDGVLEHVFVSGRMSDHWSDRARASLLAALSKPNAQYYGRLSRLNDEVKKRNEERDGVGCKLTASFDTRIKKICEMDKWAIF